MESIEEVISLFPNLIDLMGVLILMFGFIRGGFKFFKMEFYRLTKKGNQFKMIEMIRGEVSLYILLSIDFMIASDIINTMIYRDLETVVILASIVVIRTFISYFLEKEVEDVHNEQKKFTQRDTEVTDNQNDTKE